MGRCESRPSVFEDRCCSPATTVSCTVWRRRRQVPLAVPGRTLGTESDRQPTCGLFLARPRRTGGPDGTVYFAASIWPFMGTFIYALDARTGKVRWRNDATGDQYQKQPHAAPSFGGVAPQGQLAVAGELLLVPGGRSLPAGFDRTSGQLKFFSFGDKGQGGSFVAADATRAFVHTRVRGTTALSLPKGTVAKFQVNEPVLAGEILYTAVGATTAKSVTTPPRIQAYDAKNQVLWHLDADGTGDLIKAGNRLYAAGGGKLTAVDLPGPDGPARVAWTQNVEGEVCRLVAAADRLFAVTLDGRVLAFGETRIEPAVVHRSEPLPPDGQALPEARGCWRHPASVKAMRCGSAWTTENCWQPWRRPRTCTSSASIPTPTRSTAFAAGWIRPAGTAGGSRCRWARWTLICRRPIVPS